jgi:hypothetical protein
VRRRSAVALMVAVGLLVGCGQARRATAFFGKLFAIQKAVQQEVGPYPVAVNLNNGRYLTVGIDNSPLHDLPREEKAAKAKAVAGIAYRAYPDREELAQVSVVFWVRKTYFLLFHMNNGMDVHAYDVGELRGEDKGGVGGL